MSDVDPGAQLSTTDLGEQEVEDAIARSADEIARSADEIAAASSDDQPHPHLVEGGVGASATGVGTDDLDAAVEESPEG
jgi:hypothetical protein